MPSSLSHTIKCGIRLVVVPEERAGYRGLRISSQDLRGLGIVAKPKLELTKDHALGAGSRIQDCTCILPGLSYDLEPLLLVKIVKDRRRNRPVSCPGRLGKLAFVFGIGQIFMSLRQILLRGKLGIVDDYLYVAHILECVSTEGPAADLLGLNLSRTYQWVNLCKQFLPVFDSLISAPSNQRHVFTNVSLYYVIRGWGASPGLSNGYCDITERLPYYCRHVDVKPESLLKGGHEP